MSIMPRVGIWFPIILGFLLSFGIDYSEVSMIRNVYVQSVRERKEKEQGRIGRR